VEEVPGLEQSVLALDEQAAPPARTRTWFASATMPREP
jgi:hypothetical protein